MFKAALCLELALEIPEKVQASSNCVYTIENNMLAPSWSFSINENGDKIIDQGDA